MKVLLPLVGCEDVRRRPGTGDVAEELLRTVLADVPDRTQGFLVAVVCSV